MSIPIEKVWNGLARHQQISDNSGNVWLINDIITHSRELPELDIPLEHLYIDYKIGGIQIREFVQHMKQILDCDLSFPILLDEHGSLLDGRHRIAKALFDEEDSIKAKRFLDEVKPSFTEHK